MRIRSVKPEFYRSDDIASVPREDRLLFIGLWSYVDDNGVGVDKVSSIAADLYAPDLARDAPDTLAMVTRGLQNLSDAGLITRYRVAGKPYLYVTGWMHQRIDKPNVPRLPLPDGQVRRPVHGDREKFATLSRDLPETPLPGTGEQGNRGTGEQQPSSPLRDDDAPPPLALVTAPTDAVDRFDEFWKAYPRKVSKASAAKAWKSAVKKTHPQVIIEAVHAHASMTWLGKEHTFIPHAASWLNAERWNDPVEEPSRPRPQAWQEAQNSQFEEWGREYGYALPGNATAHQPREITQ